MAQWYTISCVDCGHDVHVCEDWSTAPRFCKPCREERNAKWYDVSCAECGDEFRACRDWEHQPRFCASCRRTRAERWYEKACRACGGSMRVSRDWDRIPDFHRECAWLTRDCEICGLELRIHRGWEHQPRVHKECRAAQAAKWSDVSCKHCGGTLRVCQDWKTIPRYHKDCAWTTTECVLCHDQIRIHRGWERPPRFHKECWQSVAPETRTCTQCSGTFSLSAGMQIYCRENGYELPRRCPECKHDALLIKGAIGALRDQFPFPLVTEIVHRGFAFVDKVAVVRNRRTGEVVAEVAMDTEGLISTRRVAIAVDRSSREIAGKTYGRMEGIFHRHRTAETYEPGRDQPTHRTNMIDKGLLFSDVVARTERTDGTGRPAITRTRTVGWLLPESIADTDQDRTRG